MKHVIRELVAAVVVDENGDECVAMWPEGRLRIPRVVMGSDEMAVASIRQVAPQIARAFGVKVQLVRLSVREDLESFEP